VLPHRAAADATFVYAVQISANIQVDPPQIALHWEPDPFGAATYTVYRKSKTANDWGSPVAILPDSATDYTDDQVNVGAAYEYQIVKAAALGYTGYGYIYSGINAPLVDSRGTLLLVIEATTAGPLSGELSRLQSDLIGDGWQVIRHDVSSNDAPATVRAAILNDYYADPSNVSAVFLFGHVPVLRSGEIAYDSHGVRPMPADAYYGDVNDDWPTDPAISPTFLPSDVRLMVGRVDLAGMPGAGAPTPWPSETELLRNYLNKDHEWRHKLVTVQRRALMANRIGDYQGQALATSGYRYFEPLVGPGNTIEADVEDVAPDAQRWISMVTSSKYLWSYACSGGENNALGWLGVHPPYETVYSTDIVDQNAQAVFAMFFGSWLGDWDESDSILRSILATPTVGLTCCMAGRPHWFFHHMGLGEPIGYSARLSMNNSTLYQNQSNAFPRAVYVALMGDPTLRLDPVAPPSNLTASFGTAGVDLSWSASTDEVLGYHVYRASSPTGPFSRLTGSLVSLTSFTDASVPTGTFTYMVRAVALQTTPSGSYYNPSQGIFATTDVVAVPPILLRASLSNNSLLLSWNSQPGVIYRVQSSSEVNDTTWTELSGPLTATGPVIIWQDQAIDAAPRKFYRVVSP
jgi:hypothetical protein